MWCKFNYINNYLWLVKNNNDLKPRYTEPCDFLTKRAWVNQQCTLVVARTGFGNDYTCHYIIHTQQDCPSQMNSNLLISVDFCQSANFRSFVRDNHAGSVFLKTTPDINIPSVPSTKWAALFEYLAYFTHQYLISDNGYLNFQCPMSKISANFTLLIQRRFCYAMHYL